MKINKTIIILLTLSAVVALSGCSNKHKTVIEQAFSFENQTCKLSDSKDNGCIINEIIANNLTYEIKEQNKEQATVEVKTIDLEKTLYEAIENAEYSDDYVEYLDNIQKHVIEQLENGAFEIKTSEIVLVFEENNGNVVITNKDEIARIVFGETDESN